MMIRRALLLRDPLDLFIKRAIEKPEKGKRLPREDELSSSDWEILALTAEILKPFYDQTLRLQSKATEASHGSLWETIPTIEFLLSGLETQATRFGRNVDKVDKGKKVSSKRAPKQKEEDDYDHHQHLLVCVKNAQDKLEEYYKRMQESPVYAASVVLNPQHKKHWFNFHWKTKRDWIEKAEKKC